jgi:hypothetical protein
VSGQLHAPAALLPRKEPPGTHWMGGWVGPRASLDDVEKIYDPTGTRTPDPSIVQPVASRTDYANPVPPPPQKIVHSINKEIRTLQRTQFSPLNSKVILNTEYHRTYM